MKDKSFGEFVRILRIKKQEVIGDTAKILGVKPSVLSAVENGKQSVPSAWSKKLAAHFNLSASEQSELKQAIDKSNTQLS